MNDQAEIKHLRELLGLQERFFDHQVASLRNEWRIQEGANKIALELQEKEYARRLDALNHESARIQQAAARSVSAELYQADKNALCTRMDVLEKRLIENKDVVTANINQQAGYAAAWGKFAIMVAIALPLLMQIIRWQM